MSGGGEMIERIRSLLQGRGPLILGLGLALATLTFVIFVATRPAMVPLFTGLSLEDAAVVVERLAAENVPYRLGDRGGSILVPASRLHEIRLMMAREGLPTGGVVGLESFSGSGWSSTDLDRQVRLIQALQGELTRTILQLKGVAGARVHLVLPRESIFAGQSRPAAAAVMVQLRPGHTLSRDQVASITHLVAGAVPDLSPDQVTVLDAAGRLLSSGSGPPAGPALLQHQTEAREYLEARLAQELKGVLEQVLGPGNALVTVRADLDFSSRESEQVLVDPSAGPLVRSHHETRETYQGTGSPAAGGPAGSAANLPGASIPLYGSATEQPNRSEYERTETLVNYELNQTLERVVTAPGTITRLTAAVVVNRDLSAAEEETVARVVRAALGLDPGRGDELAVVGMPFDTSLVDRLLEDWVEPAPSLPAWWLPGLGGSGVMVLLALILWSARRARRRRPAATQPPRVRRPEEESSVPGPALRPWARVAEPVPDGGAWSDLMDLARQKPEVVARLLRVWISDN
ncbi:MAG: flagellar basal-body MS-ring/collar protein FliF [bacterium]|nr:flagellar basal-body MS-ring/collar protein FliF [bacterium]